MKLYRVSTENGPVTAIEKEGTLYACDMPKVGTDGSIEDVHLGKKLGSLAAADLLAPVSPSKVIAIGANYLDHIREANMEPPPAPLIFSKFPSTLTGPTDPIFVDRTLTQRVDWEVELAVVIGRTMRHVPETEVFDYVLGYTVANDVSARDVQFGDGQWVRGKSFDSFCPIGPAITTRDDVSDPQNLSLSLTVNGKTMQSSNTAEMFYKIPHLLAYCATCFTLEPGDVILTGTPWGCGEFMSPQVSLKEGDVVVATVEGLGTLKNQVQDFTSSALKTAAE